MNNSISIEYRKCKKCGEEKELLNSFRCKIVNGKSYYDWICKNCVSIRDKASPNYRKNKKLKDKKYYLKNSKNLIKKTSIWRQNNVSRRRAKDKERRKNNPFVRLSLNFRSMITTYLKRNNVAKNNKITELLSYSIKELKTHLEKQFEPWMNWKNWGIYDSKTWNDDDHTTWTWQLDHIIPHSEFYYTSTSDDNFKLAWDLSNLRPYSSKLNSIEGSNRKRHKK